MHEAGWKRCCAAVASVVVHLWERETQQHRGYEYWRVTAENTVGMVDQNDHAVTFRPLLELSALIDQALNEGDLTILAIQEKYGVEFSVDSGHESLTVTLVHVEQQAGVEP